MDFLNQVIPAIEKALIQDLPDIKYNRYLPGKQNSDGSRKTEPALRRPHRSDIEVFVFPQTWSDTSLGFGGMAGQAFTTAYVTVVISEFRNAAVYMGGTLAYVVPVSSDLQHDMAKRQMHDVTGAHKHYGRDPREAGNRPDHSGSGQSPA